MDLDLVEFAIMFIPPSRVLSQAGPMTSCVQPKVLGTEYVHCSCSLVPASVPVPLAFRTLRTTIVSAQTSTSCLHQVWGVLATFNWLSHLFGMRLVYQCIRLKATKKRTMSRLHPKAPRWPHSGWRFSGKCWCPFPECGYRLPSCTHKAGSGKPIIFGSAPPCLADLHSTAVSEDHLPFLPLARVPSL